MSLHKYFISGALEVWIKVALCKIETYRSVNLNVRIEEVDLSIVNKWLYDASEFEELKHDVEGMDLKNAFEWSKAIRRGG